VVEAMMCGTPVIAFERGSMKELIVHGKTGFLVRDCEDAIAAVGELNSINRKDCRSHALHHFSSQVMAKHYIALYRKIAGSSNGL
jgi:glycosyltransferase involved in cell wall biosynthesis